MSDPTLSLKQLRKILKKHGCSEDSSRGDGSHTMFFKNIGGEVFSYTVPTSRKDVLPCYVKGAREKFKLRSADGVSDDDFYNP